MKATVVTNTNGEPRILLELESAEERELMKDAPDLRMLVRGEFNGDLADLAYTIQRPVPGDLHHLARMHASENRGG